MRRKYGIGMHSGSGVKGEDINPMDGVANLADIMLVFACGLMLALILNWNVDVAGTANGTVQVDQGQEVTDMAGLDGDGTDNPDKTTQYEEYGIVYRNPSTGKLYMITDGGD